MDMMGDMGEVVVANYSIIPDIPFMELSVEEQSMASSSFRPAYKAHYRNVALR